MGGERGDGVRAAGRTRHSSQPASQPATTRTLLEPGDEELAFRRGRGQLLDLEGAVLLGLEA